MNIETISLYDAVNIVKLVETNQNLNTLNVSCSMYEAERKNLQKLLENNWNVELVTLFGWIEYSVRISIG